MRAVLPPAAEHQGSASSRLKAQPSPPSSPAALVVVAHHYRDDWTHCQVPIKSLPQDWLWCETWCSDEAKTTAKTIDLCNNPRTKEPKLKAATRSEAKSAPKVASRRSSPSLPAQAALPPLPN